MERIENDTQVQLAARYGIWNISITQDLPGAFSFDYNDTMAMNNPPKYSVSLNIDRIGLDQVIKKLTEQENDINNLNEPMKYKIKHR